MAKVTLPLRRGQLDADLPDVCIVTGEPAETMITEQFKWRPSWVILLILVNVLIMIIVAIIMTKKVTLMLPLAESQASYFRTRRLFTLLFVLIGLGCLVAGVTALIAFSGGPGRQPMIDPGFAVLGGGIGMLLFLIVAAVYHDRGVVPISITEHEITLKNVHPNFADAWEQMEDDRDNEDE